MATIAIVTPISDAYQGDPWEDVKSRISGATLTNGLIVYDDPTTGTMKIADAATSSTTQQAYGMNISGTTKPSRQSVSIMRRGVVAGFDLSALNFGDLVYLDTAGTIATVANGTKTVVIGKVVGNSAPDASGNITKLLEIQFPTLNIIT